MKDMYLQHMVCTRTLHNHLSMFLDRKLTTELYQKNNYKKDSQKKKKNMNMKTNIWREEKVDKYLRI